MSHGICAGAGQLAIAAIDGIGIAARRIAQEINRNRARPAADISEHRPRERGELGERAGACVTFRQLAIIG